jgi:hypothetical protein
MKMFGWFYGDGKNKSTDISEKFNRLNKRIDDIIKKLRKAPEPVHEVDNNTQTKNTDTQFKILNEKIDELNNLMDSDMNQDIIDLSLKKKSIGSIKAIRNIITQSREILNGWKLSFPSEGLTANFQIAEFMSKVVWIGIVNEDFARSISQKMFKSKQIVEGMISQISMKVEAIALKQQMGKKNSILKTTNDNIIKQIYTSEQVAYMASSLAILTELEEIMEKLTLIFS